MSRLTASDVCNVGSTIENYNCYLSSVCGFGLLDIARTASGCTSEPRGVSCAVVPITSGQGIIGGFCAAVKDILAYLGCNAHIMKETDIKGISEAVSQGFSLIFTADDLTFSAINPTRQYVSDNGDATGRGFAAALELAACGVSGRDALVLGAGPVGRSAARYLSGRGANVWVYDIDKSKSESLAASGIRASQSLEQALRDIPLIVDATPSGAFIKREMLRSDTIIAAPGVPCGPDEDTMAWLEGRIIHDILQIGVATMLMDTLG